MLFFTPAQNGSKRFWGYFLVVSRTVLNGSGNSPNSRTNQNGLERFWN